MYQTQLSLSVSKFTPSPQQQNQSRHRDSESNNITGLQSKGGWLMILFICFFGFIFIFSSFFYLSAIAQL